MLKKEITYEDYNGDTVTDVLYFNLSTTELLEMETGVDGGMQKMIEKIIEEQDVKKMIEEFKKILLMSFGMRSDNGKRFIKNAELREEFEQSAAFDALFMQMAEDPTGAAQFITGILPKKLQEQASKLPTPGIPRGVPAVVDTTPVD